MPEQTKRRGVNFIPFFLFLIIFLCITNFVIYNALAVVLMLQSASDLVLLGTVLGLLALSFFFASILGMKYYNVFTRTFYTLSAMWMGMYFYLFLASVLYGLLAFILGTVPHALGLALFVLAALVSVYGFLHAGNLKVKAVEIKLSNLPDLWHGRKVIWVSDIHLGQVHGALFAEKVVDTILKHDHDMIFVGGDLYDGTSAPDASVLIEPFRKLNPKLGTYFITGNHEEYGNIKKFLDAVKNAGMRILMDEKVEVEGVDIVGVDYRSAVNRENFRNILSGLGLVTENPSILLKHEPKDLDVAHASGISMQISGHTHKAQAWPLEYVARRTYKGFSHGLKGLKEMQVYVSSGVGTWGPPMRVGTDSEIVLFTFLPQEK